VLALSSGSLHTYGLARVFALAAAAGFEAIEVLLDDRWDTRHAEYLRQLSRLHNIPISSLHDPFLLQVPGWPNDPVARIQRTADLACELGISTVVIHLPLRVRYVIVRGTNRTLMLPISPSPNSRLRRWMQDGLPAFDGSSGPRICVENMPARRILGLRLNVHWWNTVAEWQRFPSLTLDTTHLGTWGLDIMDVYRRARARVRHVHLSNFNGREHRRLEDGHLPLADLLRALRSDGYEGHVVVELAPESLEAHDETQVLAHLKNQTAFCHERLVG